MKKKEEETKNQFLLGCSNMRERERKKEKEKKKIQTSLFDLRSFVSWNSSG